jgi:peroxiredoxin
VDARVVVREALRMVVRISWLAALLAAPLAPAAAAAPAGVGEAAPNFTLLDLNGRRFELHQVARAHRVTVLNFWATWCAPCLTELPEFDAIYRELSPRGVAMLAPNVMETAAKVQRFARDTPLHMHVLLDPDSLALQGYVGFGAGLPVTVLIDQRGRVRHRFVGATSAAALREKLLALLAERPLKLKPAAARPAAAAPRQP